MKIIAKIMKILTICVVFIFVSGFMIQEVKRRTKAGWQNNERHSPYGPYEMYFKRPLDLSLSFIAILVLGPLMLMIALLVKIKLGTPVIFSQFRPGLNENIFKLHKFRSMTDEKDENGDFLADEARLTSFGRKLRSTSLDELPELFDIFIGNLSIVGPRPQLVRDMVFMSERQRKRHEVMPGLTGLAQINGRNNIDWDKKLEYDLRYEEKISFFGDLEIIMKTISKAFISREGIAEKGKVTATDYGDYLLEQGKVSGMEYERKQKEAISLLKYYGK